MVTCAGSAAADFGPSWLTGGRRSWATATLPCRCRPFQARGGNCAPPHSAGAAGGANGTAPRPSEEDRGAAELLRSGGVLRREVARERGVERDTRAHRRRHGRLGDVAPLRRGRLEAQDLVERGGVVLHQLLVGERGLADDEVQVGVLVDAE